MTLDHWGEILGPISSMGSMLPRKIFVSITFHSEDSEGFPFFERGRETNRLIWGPKLTTLY